MPGRGRRPRCSRPVRQAVVVRQPLPPVAAVVSFIDAINHGDVARLALLMSDDHRLHVFDESPVDGKEANVEAWNGYSSSFPDYVIYPHQVVAREAEVVVLGHTTGSHLDLPDEQESTLTLIWRAVVREGRVHLWQLIEDRPARRAEFGLAV
jgi:hypothetical protein